MGSATFSTPEQHAANPPESWRVTRVQRGSRVRWEVRIHTDSTYPAESFSTKREAEHSISPEGCFGKLYGDARRYFAGEPVQGGAYRHCRPWAEVVAEKEERERARARKAERAGLPIQTFDAWEKLVNTADVADRAGELGDLLGELFDWFTQSEPLIVDALTLPEAEELHRDLEERFDLAGDVEAELHRVKVLGIGADRTAVEVLEDLAQIEREREQMARIGVAA